MRTIPKPTIQRINSSMGTIYVFRNPITKAWLFNITVSRKLPADTLNLEIRPTNVIAKLAYTCTLVAMVLVFFVGCNVTESAHSDRGVQVSTVHPTACIEMPPVVPDTIIRGLEKWTLKANSTGLRAGRNRCIWDSADEWVECDSKSRSPFEPTMADTVYLIDTYCPATLKAKAELGGN